MIVYISIGNSDDVLTQQEWALFCCDVHDLLIAVDVQFHGKWYSAPVSRYQNACFCVEFSPARVSTAHLIQALRRFAHKYRQQSIAWAEVPITEFLSPSND